MRPVARGLPDNTALPALPSVAAATAASVTSGASLSASHPSEGHAAACAEAGPPQLQQTRRAVRGVEYGPLHGRDGARSAPHPPWRAGRAAWRHACAELQERRALRAKRRAFHVRPQYAAGAGGGTAPLRSHGDPDQRLHRYKACAGGECEAFAASCRRHRGRVAVGRRGCAPHCGDGPWRDAP